MNQRLWQVRVIQSKKITIIFIILHNSPKGGNTPSNEVRILNGKCTGSSYQQIEEPKDAESNQIDFEQIVQNIKKEDLHEDNYFPMEEATLKESIISFLKIVLDAELLEQFGFPDAPVEKVPTFEIQIDFKKR